MNSHNLIQLRTGISRSSPPQSSPCFPNCQAVVRSTTNTKDARGTLPLPDFANDKSLKDEHAPALVQNPLLTRSQMPQLRLYFVPNPRALRQGENARLGKNA